VVQVHLLEQRPRRVSSFTAAISNNSNQHEQQLRCYCWGLVSVANNGSPGCWVISVIVRVIQLGICFACRHIALTNALADGVLALLLF
jgi:hypothetical protein